MMYASPHEECGGRGLDLFLGEERSSWPSNPECGRRRCDCSRKPAGKKNSTRMYHRKSREYPHTGPHARRACRRAGATECQERKEMSIKNRSILAAKLLFQVFASFKTDKISMRKKTCQGLGLWLH